MSSKTVSFDLDPANLLWLEARALASGNQSLSKILNEVLERVRNGGQTKAVRSVRGTIRLPESDPDLENAKGAVRELFRQSIERTAGFLAEDDEAGS